MQQRRETGVQSRQKTEEPDDELVGMKAELADSDDVRSLGSFSEEDASLHC